MCTGACRSGVDSADQDHPRTLPWNLRGATRACRTRGPRNPREPKAPGSRDAGCSYCGCHRRRYVRTTRRRRDARPAPDLVERDFTAPGPDRLWVADITYIPTWAGFLYLAIVVDAFSRRVVGWAMQGHLRTQLVLDALNMARWQRRPTNVVHHCGHGTQYTSLTFGARCREAGVRPSMGSVGGGYDNALCESFFATLECELLKRSSFRTHGEARAAVFEFIEGCYNTHRRHSSIGNLSPIDYENKCSTAA